LDNDELLSKQLISMTIDKMSVFLSSGDVEAQERVCPYSILFNREKKILSLGKCHSKYS